MASVTINYKQEVAYAFSDKIKIIDLGWPSRSLTISTVGAIFATAGLLVSVFLRFSAAAHTSRVNCDKVAGPLAIEIWRTFLRTLRIA